MKAIDVAKHLKIKESTLRKYALLFEAKGYLFARDAQNNRVYSQKDLKILKSFIDLRHQNLKLTNEKLVMMLDYDFQSQPVLSNSNFNKCETSEDKLTSELEGMKIKVSELEKKIDTLHATVLNIFDSLEKTIETIKIEQVIPNEVEQSKKKSVWKRIKSR